MNQLMVGFARLNITPVLGIGLAGYFFSRQAEGILDELEMSALALCYGESKALLLSVDNEGITKAAAAEFRQLISEHTGVPNNAIYIHSTHIHTGPYCNKEESDMSHQTGELEQEYFRWMCCKVVDVTRIALDDMKPAKMGWGVGQAPNIAFVRRFRMRDGSIQTNPGIGNSNIVEPVGKVDERVSVLRFDREGTDTIVLTHFTNHSDTIGGNMISADWPGMARKTVEKALDGVKCMVLNGAMGDINHINVCPTPGYSNERSERYSHTRYMGRVVAGGVLQAFDKVKYLDVKNLVCKVRTITVPSNMPKQEELSEAHRIYELYLAGRADELPYDGMMITTIVAEAIRMVELEQGPETFEMELMGLAIGDVALVGFPGEPFVGIGNAIKETEGWELVLPTSLTNGYQGYFPMLDDFTEGGYEARSSMFRPGVAELMIEEARKLLEEIRLENSDEESRNFSLER